MRWLWRWLRKNLRDTHEERIDKTEEFYLHESWFDHFQSDLDSWARRNG